MKCLYACQKDQHDKRLNDSQILFLVLLDQRHFGTSQANVLNVLLAGRSKVILVNESCSNHCKELEIWGSQSPDWSIDAFIH